MGQSPYFDGLGLEDICIRISDGRIQTKSGEILGVHIVGPQATELIHEAALAMQMRGAVQDVEATIHSHPCLHEAMQRVAKQFFFS